MNNIFSISKSGWKFISYAIGMFLLFSIFDLEILSYLSFALVLCLAYLYRNPERTKFTFENKSVVSPVDGTVISVEKIEENQKYAYKIIIDSQCFDVGTLRAPMTSVVKDLSFIKGTKLSNNTNLAKKLNEKLTFTLEDAMDNRVQIEHFSKQNFGDISSELTINKKLARSEIYGFMLSGITTLYLSKNFKPAVASGSRVEAASMLLGSF